MYSDNWGPCRSKVLSCILVIEAFALIYAFKVLCALVISAFALAINCWPLQVKGYACSISWFFMFWVLSTFIWSNPQNLLQIWFSKSRSSAIPQSWVM